METFFQEQRFNPFMNKILFLFCYVVLLIVIFFQYLGCAVIFCFVLWQGQLCAEKGKATMSNCLSI